MTLFLLLCGLLTLLALAFIGWPLFTRPRLQDHRRQTNKAIYKQRLAEIQADLDSGRLDAGQAEAQRDLAGQALLTDLAETQGVATSRQSGRMGTLLVLLAIPALATGLYLQGDSWRLVGATQEQPAWDYLLGRMEAHLEDQPQDSEALLMLARTRRASQDIEGAIQAYQRLNEVSQFKVAEYLADEAETRILAQDGAFSDIARLRLQQALAADPNDGRALWYSGLAELSDGKPDTARKHWLRLSRLQLPEGFRKVLHQQLARLGVDTEALEPATTNQIRIQLRIVATAEMLRGLAPDTPLFVMARPADGGRAMLAVRRHKISELPLDTVLTDGMNMAGGPELSAYKHWRIEARISTGGDAMPSSGDPIGQLEVTAEAIDKPLLLQINQRKP